MFRSSTILYVRFLQVLVGAGFFSLLCYASISRMSGDADHDADDASTAGLWTGSAALVSAAITLGAFLSIVTMGLSAYSAVRVLRWGARTPEATAGLVALTAVAVAVELLLLAGWVAQAVLMAWPGATAAAGTTIDAIGAQLYVGWVAGFALAAAEA